MQKTITKVSDLLAAFSLDNYAACSDFQLQDWVVNFEFRTLQRSVCSSLEERKKASLHLLHNALLPEKVCRLYLKKGIQRPVRSRQVRDQTVFEALDSYSLFEEDPDLNNYVTIYRNWMNDTYPEGAQAEDFDLLHIPMWKALQEAGRYFQRETNIVVNLRCSDSQLIDEFTKWIKLAKEAQGIKVPKRSLSSEDLNGFAKHKVLAYLDLTYWAAAYGYYISNQTLGLALFPDEYDVVLSDRIRKVVLPLARKVTTHDYCKYVRAQLIAQGVELEKLNFVPEEKKILGIPVS